jgi:hypothetical protein
MPDEPKTPPPAAGSHARDLHKVSEQLKSLVASLRTEKERMVAESRQHGRGEAPSPAEACAAAGAPDAAQLVAELALAREAIAHANAERERLHERLEEIQAENQRICDEYVAVQEQSTELAQLFVALERIHGGVSRAETLAALQEIVINVLGSEELAIFERRGDTLVLTHSFGVDASALREIPLGRGAIGRSAASGHLYVAGRDGEPSPGDEDLTAAIPLRAGEEIAGVLAIFRLLGHKPGLDAEDEALFQLLSRHAGLALRLRDGRDRPVVG